MDRVGHPPNPLFAPGRNGHFIPLGDSDGYERAARGTVPMGMEPHKITPIVMRALVAMPRRAGVHPETGKAIHAGIGLCGLWVKRGPTYMLLPDDLECSRSVATGPSRRWMRKG